MAQRTTVQWYVLMLACAASGALHAAAVDRDAYRGSLVGLMDVLRDVHARAGAQAPGSRVQIDRAAELFGALGDREIDTLAIGLPEARLRGIVRDARAQLDAAPLRSKDVVVSSPDVTPAFCNDYPPQVVLAALTTKHVAAHVIEGLEFSCNELVAGINAALTCEGPEIAAAAADIASEFADFCGNQQSAATNDGLLYTGRSIGAHLNTQLDVALSTRATQTSLDALAETAAATDSTVADAADQLDTDMATIDAQLAGLLDDLSDLAAAASDLQSRTDDIVFRVRVTQADVEDVQDRSADLREKSTELTNVLGATRTDANGAQTIAATLTPAIEATARQQRRDELAIALGRPDARMAGFALPGSAGGRLEEAREVLISAILALQTLGQGNTAQALTLLAAGDQQYNAGHYADAWRQFSAAYRALDPNVGATR